MSYGVMLYGMRNASQKSGCEMCDTVGVHDVRQGSAPSSDLLSTYDSIVLFFNQLHTSQPQRGPTLLNASHV